MDRKRSQGHSRSKVTILVLDPVFMYQHQQFLQSSLSDREMKKVLFTSNQFCSSSYVYTSVFAVGYEGDPLCVPSTSFFSMRTAYGLVNILTAFRIIKNSLIVHYYTKPIQLHSCFMHRQINHYKP